jgi:hypothetical protein
MMATFKPQTEARANSIAAALNGRPKMLGIDINNIILIIQELLPIIIDCFDPDDGPQAAEYVLKRFSAANSDNDYRGYDKRLVKATARRTKQAARRKRQRVTWTQAYEMSFATLDDIRQGDPQQASIAISENHEL